MSEKEKKIYQGGMPDQYELPEEESHYIDVEKGEVVKSKDLSPFQIIELTAKEMGIKIKKPRHNCKHCYGRGYVGININTKEPIACRCIYVKEDKDEVELKGQQLYLSRKQKRTIMRKMKKDTKKKKRKEYKNKNKKNLINRLPSGKIKANLCTENEPLYKLKKK